MQMQPDVRVNSNLQETLRSAIRRLASCNEQPSVPVWRLDIAHLRSTRMRASNWSRIQKGGQPKDKSPESFVFGVIDEVMKGNPDCSMPIAQGYLGFQPKYSLHACVPGYCMTS
ncbi:hypothetical protein BofuT4_P057720.1 [Botrytis cinerea T4]|uniref:Uncharacterized protein n=1 Tax=Botryotinia fuckeliana (strain T4) TaxID=999810 RepID=G2XUM2_BOTF4|nr:hypothetical protein BofuT4_P057720.1 [Botrytis cinerea T4]